MTQSLKQWKDVLKTCVLRAWLLVVLVAAVAGGSTGCGNRSSSAAKPAQHEAKSTTAGEHDNLLQPTSAVRAPLVDSPPPATAPILAWEQVETLTQEIAVFDHVFWQPDDTSSLRQLIRDTGLVAGKSVLEIGTGSGIVALCCLQASAASVVATDINPWAVRNAVYNGRLLHFEDRFQVRQVAQNRPQAWSVIGPQESFDVIVSNPPWEPGQPKRVEDFAFYDTDFRLMESLVDGLPVHLKPNGRALLAYGCVTAIRQLQKLVQERGYTFTVHDDRDLDHLPDVFLPGMLIEIHLGK